MPGRVNLRASSRICPGKPSGHLEVYCHRDLILLTLCRFLGAKNRKFRLVDYPIAVLGFQIAVTAPGLCKSDKRGLIFVVKILVKLNR